MLMHLNKGILETLTYENIIEEVIKHSSVFKKILVVQTSQTSRRRCCVAQFSKILITAVCVSLFDVRVCVFFC